MLIALLVKLNSQGKMELEVRSFMDRSRKSRKGEEDLVKISLAGKVLES